MNDSDNIHYMTDEELLDKLQHHAEQINALGAFLNSQPQPAQTPQASVPASAPPTDNGLAPSKWGFGYLADANGGDSGDGGGNDGDVNDYAPSYWGLGPQPNSGMHGSGSSGNGYDLNALGLGTGNNIGSNSSESNLSKPGGLAHTDDVQSSQGNDLYQNLSGPGFGGGAWLDALPTISPLIYAKSGQYRDSTAMDGTGGTKGANNERQVNTQTSPLTPKPTYQGRGIVILTWPGGGDVIGDSVGSHAGIAVPWPGEKTGLREFDYGPVTDDSTWQQILTAARGNAYPSEVVPTADFDPTKPDVYSHTDNLQNGQEVSDRPDSAILIPSTPEQDYKLRQFLDQMTTGYPDNPHMRKCAFGDYNGANHQCADFVIAALNAAGVDMSGYRPHLTGAFRDLGYGGTTLNTPNALREWALSVGGKEVRYLPKGWDRNLLFPMGPFRQ